jgi:hypothetical protein
VRCSELELEGELDLAGTADLIKRVEGDCVRLKAVFAFLPALRFPISKNALTNIKNTLDGNQ